MTTNNEGHLLDDLGNVAVDFVWGNFPLQPNDVRRDNGGEVLEYTLDNHSIVEAGWNGFPQYTPNDPGEQLLGVAFVLVPNVKRLATAAATDVLTDAELTPTTASAATVAISRSYRAGGGGTSRITTSEAHGFLAGDVVVVAGTNGNSDLEGEWAILTVPTPTTFTYQTVTSGTITDDADTGTVKCAALAGKIWKQSLNPGANTIEIAAAITITPYAA